MNKCIIQLWEESERGWGVRPDGCSIHINMINHKSYIDNIYKNRGDIVPDEYDRTMGDPFECFISDSLYEGVKSDKNLRLMEHEKNNLIKLEEILFRTK